MVTPVERLAIRQAGVDSSATDPTATYGITATATGQEHG